MFVTVNSSSISMNNGVSNVLLYKSEYIYMYIYIRGLSLVVPRNLLFRGLDDATPAEQLNKLL